MGDALFCNLVHAYASLTISLDFSESMGDIKVVHFFFLLFCLGLLRFIFNQGSAVEMGSSSSKLTATTKKIDVNSLMGKHYVIACIPTPFEVGAVNAVENYEWTNEKKQELKVTFTYHTGGYDTPQQTMLQDGYVFNKDTGAEWKVRPRFWGGRIPLPMWLPYIILDGPTTETPDVPLIVGYPDRSYLWIMGRKPKMDPALYDSILKRCETEWGYTNMKDLYVVPNNFGNGEDGAQ